MQIYVIELTLGGSTVPFRIKARDPDEAMAKVNKHMGCPDGTYRVAHIEAIISLTTQHKP